MAADPVDARDEDVVDDDLPPWEMCAALGDDIRVWIVHEIFERGPQRFDELVDNIVKDTGEDREHIQNSLRHNHLTRLSEVGIVRWDVEGGYVDRGPQCERTYRFLSVGEAAIGEAKTVTGGQR